MNDKRNRTIQAVSLFIILITLFIKIVFSFIGMKLPDILVRCMGIIQIIALAVLVYSSVKMFKNKKSKL